MKYLPLVNVKQGTRSVPRFSNGNTLPLTQLPFAMLGFAPQTKGGSWFYHPGDRCLEGIRLTHQPSPWISDYGAFVFTPQVEPLNDESDDAWSGYYPENAVLGPDYIKLYFLRSRAEFELTPSVRGGKIRLRFSQGKKPYLSVFSVRGEHGCEIDAEKNTVKVFTTGNVGKNAVGFKNYVVIKFNVPIDSENTKIINSGDEDENACVHIAFNSLIIEADIASSYIGFEQAEENMRQELSGKSFDDIQKAAADEWEKYLSKIEIESDDSEQMKTFYSCMYRTGLFPHKAYEITADGKKIHYCPFDGTVRDGVRYTDNGFWDTYRTEFPLLALIDRDGYAEMLEGFIADYKDGGWLPRWPSIGERGCMPSTLIDAVIADAAVKGIIGGELLETALEGMINHAENDAPESCFGREGASDYVKLGYVPREKYKQSVNLTLDSAYGDFCIAQVAKVLGKDDIVKKYLPRSKNYKNLFDKETGFMRGRDSEGKMKEDFDPFDWGGEYTEGSAWQSSFAVPHDIEGLAELYGGKEELIKKLDELFSTPPVYGVGGYEREIHEMSEMAAADFGQCAISNQPSFHIPYIYAALGEKEKTEYWIKRLCEEGFGSGDDGFPGDEDNGATAAWYILGTLGIYDICPGKNEYIRINKLVKKAKILGEEI